MKSFLSLPDTQILHIQGWGNRGWTERINPNDKFRIELAAEGELAVYRQSMFGEQRLTWLNLYFTNLELQAWTDTVQTGGKFIGGGLGVTGAAEGMLAASIMNALSTRRREYALFAVFDHAPDGSSRRDIVFGFRNLTESRLRLAVGTALSNWVEDSYQQLLGARKGWDPEEFADVGYEEIDLLLARSMLTQEQHARYEAELAKHAPRPGPPSGTAPALDRVEQLKTLGELRESGVLTEEEFQAEKTRLLVS